ncbi:MAG: metallophosphoesterase family protein [Bacteroidota bacterium]|nr:metallophosphoesterase family protein [Cytophagales bacterium]MCE2957155.1 metallophosphatase family protein [Flammeovirgaceae bacterium]MCZ8071086.1 metallophosphoesterase family protein [Cytophagales bacterium]
MKIGLISDTHSYLDPKVLEYFQSVDEIWHAGDIGEVSVTQQLQQLKPLRAVYGNVDDKNLQALYPEDLWFDCEGLRIWMTHIAGAPPNYNPRTKKIFKEKSADVLICGHSHILKVIKDPKYNLLYVNPGAAGNHGFHHIKTIMRFEILNKEIKNMEVIELGKRGQL